MLCLVHLTGPIASYTILLAIQYSRGPKTSPLSYAFDKAYCLDHYIIYLVGSFRVPYRTTKISGLFLPWRLERDSKFPLLRPVTFPSLSRHFTVTCVRRGISYGLAQIQRLTRSYRISSLPSVTSCYLYSLVLRYVSSELVHCPRKQ